MRVRFHRLLAVIAGTVLLPANAFAACTVPAGIAGDILYNSTYNVLQFCNGTTWINAGSSNASGIGTLTSGDFCTTDGTNINCTTAVVAAANGGTGVANSNNITLGGNVSTAGAFTTSGANALTLTTTGTTNVTLPTSGTLVNSGVATLSSLVSIGTITTGTWNGTVIGVPYGGTGAASLTGILEGNGTSAVTALTGTTSYVARWTSANAIGTGILYDNGTNVGIGTSSPVNTLQIGSMGSSAYTNNSLAVGNGSQVFALQIPASGPIFYTNSNFAFMPANGTGNVGIGTTNPTEALTIVGGADAISLNGSIGTTQRFILSTGWNGSKNYFGIRSVVNSTASLALDSTGNVGIGTTVPNTAFQVRVGAAQNINIRSSNSNPDLAFVNDGFTSHVKGSINANPLIINTDSGGNVGIGTTGPSYALDVAGVSRAQGFIVGGGTATYAAGSIYTDSNWGMLFRAAVSGAAASFAFHNSVDTALMTILNNGSVGIGTASPLRKLEVNNAMRLTNSSSDANDGVIGTAPFAAGLNIVGINTDSTNRKIAYWGALQQQDTATNYFQGNVGIGLASPLFPFHLSGTSNTPSLTAAAGIAALATNSTVELTMGGYTGSPYGFWLQTKDDSSGGLGSGTSYPLLLNPLGGNVGIGVTNPFNKLEAYGSANQDGMYAYTANTGNAYYGIWASAGDTTYGAGLGRADGYALVGLGAVWATGAGSFNMSDGRLKENIAPLTGNLDKIGKLRPVSYTWKPDSMAYNSTGKARQLGLIAQEVKPIVPEAVILNPKPPISLGKDGKKSLDEKLEGGSFGVDYTKFVPILIGAVQELKADNDNLEARVKALEAARH